MNTSQSPAPMRRRALGFSLLELLIVLAMLAIIAAMAWPGYRTYVQRGQRAAARAALAEAAQYMERFRAVHGRYDVSRSGIGVALPAQLARAPAEGTAHHFILLEAVQPGSWRLLATPVTPDARCGTLSLDQAGVQGSSGTAPSSDCWR